MSAPRFTEEEYRSLVERQVAKASRKQDGDWPQKSASKTNKAPSPSKYRNVRCVVDGITFDSRKEAARYQELQTFRSFGEVSWFTRQVPFRLRGGTRYYADFLVVWSDGRITVEDVKSSVTKALAAYRVKKREVEAMYGFEITEI